MIAVMFDEVSQSITDWLTYWQTSSEPLSWLADNSDAVAVKLEWPAVARVFIAMNDPDAVMFFMKFPLLRIYVVETKGTLAAIEQEIAAGNAVKI